jgi:thiol:disulfide interchange protein DsbD
MEKFKVAMGFPMLVAAVWLCSLVAVHFGEQTWWLAAFLVFVALAAWVYGEFVQRGRSQRLAAALISVILLATGYFFALEHQLRWRHPPALAANATNSSKVAPRGLAWEPWSPEAVAAAQAAGRPAVVDFTAKWCPTCNAVVKPAFESSAVQKKLKEIDAVLLVADYTRFAPEITEELARLKRAAVPLVVVYPRNASLPPMIFDLPSKSALIDALDQAGRKL